MKRESLTYQTYIEILRQELVPAMGCTEPIALAYAAAKCREILSEKPERILVQASGNIIKNVKSVVVPNSGGRKGIETAAALGALFGHAEEKLQVVSGVTEEELLAFPEELQNLSVRVEPLETDHVLDLVVTLGAGPSEAVVRIQDTHTNIVYIGKDGAVLFEKEPEEVPEELKAPLMEPDYDLLTVEDIFDFANTSDLSDTREILEKQIRCNKAISDEGMKNGYGARIGQVIAMQDDSVRTQAKARAAAASDARMSGCELPVVINSGSGNQGITASIPVLVYGEYYGKSEEEILRALLVSNLVTLHLKSGIGRLSSYCGAVSAGVGAGAGIAYLLTGDLRTINHTIVNAVAISSGMVCDGAKASCAAKIALSVEAGILGFEMFLQGSQLRAGEGLVSKGVEKTIHNISRLGHDGMKETDKKIIEIMTEDLS